MSVGGHIVSRTRVPNRTFDGDAKHLLRMQADVAVKVADGTHVALSHQNFARLVGVPAVVPASYDSYVRAAGAARTHGGSGERRSAREP